MSKSVPNLCIFADVCDELQQHGRSCDGEGLGAAGEPWLCVTTLYTVTIILHSPEHVL